LCDVHDVRQIFDNDKQAMKWVVLRKQASSKGRTRWFSLTGLTKQGSPMRKTPSDNNISQKRAMRTCRVAYTLNNDQPVRCTMIGDQPLFYMDYEGAFDDELSSDDLDLPPFTAEELEVMKGSMDDILELMEGSNLHFGEGHTNFQGAHMIDADFTAERAALFNEDIKMALMPKELGEERIYEDTQDLVQTLSFSRMGCAYVEFAKFHNVSVVYSDQVTSASYDRAAQTILINPHLKRAEKILVLARELRRVWQHRHGVMVHPLTFHPDHAILVNRAQMADLTVAMVRMAWELQLAGEKDAWERIETGPMGDLARAFARESYIDFRTLNNGTAASAVFEAWFLSERCRTEDRKLIQQMLADYNGYVFASDSSSHQVTAELMAALGDQPFGKNYLSSHVGMIMGEALFTDVRDRANANFLWFIKFERSFREAEQELQSDQSINGGTSVTAENKKKIGDTNEEASVITLPTQQRRATSIDKSTLGDGQGATIISFQGHAGQS
jgi:hypothetical protein